MSRIVHYVAYDAKFIPKQIAFLSERFSHVDQLFFVHGAPADYLHDAPSSVRELRRSTWTAFIKEAIGAERVIINGLFDKRLPLLLSWFPSIARKSIWIPWGGDLYWHRFRKRTFGNEVIMPFRSHFIRMLYGIATMTRGDYEAAVDWYGTEAKHIESAPNIFAFEKSDLDRIKPKKRASNEIVVQIGNSGDPTNEHFEMMDWLAPFRDRNLRIYAPLSYGNAEYIGKVISRGQSLFGDRFTPFMTLMPFHEYNQYLASLDVLILNHRRQQGFGNVAISLYLGTKVFLRNEVTIWRYLSEGVGCVLFDSSAIPTHSLEELSLMDDAVREQNRKKISILFDREWQRQAWEKIYHE